MQTLTSNGHPLQFLADNLLLNASVIDNPELMHGKMGEQIAEIYDEITIHTPIDFENGLPGIGWGIEHLEQKGFIEADLNEVLNKFGYKISTKPICNTPKDLSYKS